MYKLAKQLDFLLFLLLWCCCFRSLIKYTTAELFTTAHNTIMRLSTYFPTQSGRMSTIVATKQEHDKSFEVVTSEITFNSRNALINELITEQYKSSKLEFVN